MGADIWAVLIRGRWGLLLEAGDRSLDRGINSDEGREIVGLFFLLFLFLFFFCAARREVVGYGNWNWNRNWN